MVTGDRREGSVQGEIVLAVDLHAVHVQLVVVVAVHIEVDLDARTSGDRVGVEDSRGFPTSRDIAINEQVETCRSRMNEMKRREKAITENKNESN